MTPDRSDPAKKGMSNPRPEAEILDEGLEEARADEMPETSSELREVNKHRTAVPPRQSSQDSSDQPRSNRT